MSAFGSETGRLIPNLVDTGPFHGAGLVLPGPRRKRGARRGVLRGPPESEMAGKARLSGGQRMTVKWARINETWYDPPPITAAGLPKDKAVFWGP